MAVRTTGAEWASESAYFSGPYVQIVQAIFRRALSFLAPPPAQDNLFLKSAGGAGCAELAEGVYQDWYGVGVCHYNVTNVADKAAAAHAQTNGPDTDNVIGRSDVVAGSIAQGRVVEAGSVLERVSTDGRVVEVGCNAIGYANFYSRSHDAVIRVYDAAGSVIEISAPSRAGSTSKDFLLFRTSARAHSAILSSI
jgi:hypothetical protein